jgi:hypothetical protein
VQTRWKVRTRLTAEAVIGGVFGSLAQPEALVLGRHDQGGRLHVVGRTRPLTGSSRNDIATVLTGADNEPPRRATIPSSRFGQRPSELVEYLRVTPKTVVELDVERHTPPLPLGRAKAAGGVRRGYASMGESGVNRLRSDRPGFCGAALGSRTPDLRITSASL